MAGETKMMEVMNGLEGLNSVKGMGVLGMIEKERVSAKENMMSRVDRSDIEIERGNKKERLEKIPVKSLPEAAVMNTSVEVKPEAQEEGTAEIKVEPPESEEKMDLNADLERAPMERLAEMERVAEKERQDKIRRREELDRVARLQRILALVRAPELDSVAKTKQAVDSDRVKTMTPGEEKTVFKELKPVLKMEKVEVKKATELKPLAEQEAVVEANLLVMKKIIKSEGIAKLERMSKSERISEIDHLVNLELEAQAKRNTEVERIAELKRSTELERGAKMKHLTEIDLPLEMEKIEKERLVEKELQENKRKEELDRVAKLQRVLVLASESDQAVEAQAANLERVKEIKRRDELKLLEELGVIPKQVTKTESGKEVKPVEGEHLVATVATDADTNSVKGIKQVTELKEVIPTKSKQEMMAEGKGEGVEDRKVANVEQWTELQNKTKREIIVEAKTEEKIKRAAEMECKAKADREARIKRREELARVANLQRVAAMVHNEVFDHVSEMEKKHLERIAEKKRRNDMKVLEELGLVSKDRMPQENETNSEVVEEKYGFTETKPVEDANIETPTKIESTQRKLSVEVDRLSGIDIEQTSDKERMAVKRDVERRLTELRVAQMKRVAELGREMKTGAIEQEKLHGEFKHYTETEPKTTEDEKKRVEESKSLKKTKVPDVIQEVGVDSKLKGVKESQPADVKPEMVRERAESVIGMQAEKELISADPRRLLEKRETVFESMELKRLSEMKRVVGMERVTSRECEWDGQMMYVGKV